VALQISSHAKERMAQRGINPADVAAALGRRIGQPQPGQPGTIWIRGYAAGGRILKVCVRASDEEFVITAVWLS
jgi:hypothetical protein